MCALSGSATRTCLRRTLAFVTAPRTTWIFEAQLRSVFTRRWGETWFEDEEAGRTLRELWSHGQRYSAVELLRQLGEPELDIAPLAADVVDLA